MLLGMSVMQGVYYTDDYLLFLSTCKFCPTTKMDGGLKGIMI